MKLKLRNYLILFLSFSIAFGCNKNALDDLNSADATDHQIQLRDDDGGGVALTPSEIPDEDIPYLPLFDNYLNDWAPRNVDGLIESFYSPSELLQLEEEENKLNSVGLPSYLSELVAVGAMSEPTMELMLFVHDNVASEDPSEFYLDDLMAEIEADFGSIVPPSEVGDIDYLYFYVYKITMKVIKDFENRAEARSKGSCSFGEAILTIYNEIAKGAKIGENISKGIKFFFKKDVKIIELTGEALGGIIGGIVGFWKSVFKKSECDCNDATSLVRVVDNDCDLTNALRANGTGADASVWEWRITQGTVTANFFSDAPEVEITQVDPAVPISATVRPVCENEADFIPNEIFDFTDKFKPVQNLTVTAVDGVWPIDPNAPSSYVRSKVGTTSRFISSAFADGSPLEWEWSVNPASAGTIVSQGDLFLNVKWLQEGFASVSATATNTCGNNSQTRTMTILVEN